MAADEYKKLISTTVAVPFREEISSAILSKYASRRPKLVGFLANDDAAARKYAEWTGKACIDDGIEYELREVAKIELEGALQNANRDPDVHGIIIYYPVFGSDPSFYGTSMDDYLRDSISPEKDVEGLCHTYRSNLYANKRYMDEAMTRKCLLPCTPLAVVKILESCQGMYDMSLQVGSRLSGKVVTIVNRSEVVGRPLSALLANDGATVFSADIDSIYLMRRGIMTKTDHSVESACLASDVIVLGVPSKAYKIDPTWIRPGAMVINVASFKNVDEEELKKIGGITYCAAVGKVTVAMLERNLLRLYENFHRPISCAGDGATLSLTDQSPSASMVTQMLQEMSARQVELQEQNKSMKNEMAEMKEMIAQLIANSSGHNLR
eukprot:CAMPEP_0185770328 /NCGR_PEP_ID=MMETSP1174-20130828/58580_1 /TAXON_ID=35687 /ORGANISM="Dictyocha speculum, Strain CCMP1381" /LENGTH=379 /DNA_ID=CAMNT_0028455715 /DNA_START=26 /DNA_END=1165 /DNA_ORIENTATION=+